LIGGRTASLRRQPDPIGRQRARKPGTPIEPPLSIATIHRGGALRIVAAGELDLASAPALEQALLDAERTDTGTILLDIDAVTFIDSTGLRTLLEAHARSHRDGNRLQVTRGALQAQRLFILAGADRILPFTDE
jgi:anti-anti-sigma factor